MADLESDKKKIKRPATSSEFQNPSRRNLDRFLNLELSSGKLLPPLIGGAAQLRMSQMAFTNKLKNDRKAESSNPPDAERTKPKDQVSGLTLPFSQFMKPQFGKKSASGFTLPKRSPYQQVFAKASNPEPKSEHPQNLKGKDDEKEAQSSQILSLIHI